MKTVIAVAMADLHRTDKRPICRKEKDILAVQDDKLEQIATIAMRHNVPLLGAGDTYDAKDCGFGLVYATRRILKDVDFRACYGQHELPDHDIGQWARSPLSQHWEMPRGASSIINNAELMYCDWGQPVPCVQYSNPNFRFKILLIHKMVYLGDAPFPGVKGNVEKIIKRAEYQQYDLIISGDNHKSFVHKYGNTTWLNCGCVYRTASNEKGYEPCCWLIQTDEKGIYVLKQPLKYNVEDVSDEHLEDTKIEKECSKEFAISLSTLPNRKKSSYSQNVQRACSTEGKRIKKTVNTFLGV